MATTAASKENALMNQATKPNKWRCDVCQVRHFGSIEEATQHEEICRKTFQSEPGKFLLTEKPVKAAAPKKQTGSKIHPFFQKQPMRSSKEAQSAKVTPPPTRLTPSEISRKFSGDLDKLLSTQKGQKCESMDSNPTGDEKANESFEGQQVVSAPAWQSSRRATRKIATLMPVKESSTAKITTKKRKISRKPAPKPSSKRPVAVHSCFEAKKPKKETIIDLSNNSSACSSNTKNKPATRPKPKKVASIFEPKKSKEKFAVRPIDRSVKTAARGPQNAETEQLAAILGVDPQTLLEQQRAAAFQAERRRNDDQRTRKQTTAAVAMVEKKKKRVVAPKFTRTCCLATRFPKPNHVFPAARYDDEDDSSKDMDHEKIQGERWFNDMRKEQMVNAWKTLSVAHGETTCPDGTGVLTPLLPDSSSIWAQTRVPDQRLHHLLASALKVVPSTKPLVSSELWADRFRLQADNICGESTLKDFESLLEWVEEWKEVRQRSLRHMEAKQEERRRKHKKQPKKKKRKTPTAYKDDDLWEDSDFEVEGLSSLCLVSGPVGSGKTNLVHAVARRSGCKLLELNTTDKRGAAALKKTIGEATQSLGNVQAQSNKKSFFGGTENGLVDSDDESGEKRMLDVSLTAILVDEVDILFEEDGDNGFWSALLELSKRAKCPIFLTAHDRPSALQTAGENFKYVVLERPSVAACTIWLQERIESFDGGLRLRPDGLPHLQEAVSLCGCDLRKLLHEMQSFALAPTSELLPFATKKDVSSSEMTTAFKTPVVNVSAVAPRSVYSDQYSLLTIMGTGFLQLATENLGQGYHVKVHIGNQICPLARILDDSTIVAVCPPAPPSKEACGRCPTNTYSAVRVAGMQALGMLSTSGRVVEVQKLSDGTIFATPPKPVNVEHHVGEKEKDAHSDDEAEFDDGMGNTGNAASASAASAEHNIDWKHATKMLKEGIDAWMTRNKAIPEPPAVSKHAEDAVASLQEIELACTRLSLISDAALFEDLGQGMPTLAGPVRGFGFDFTGEAFPGCTTEKNKPPSEDMLYELGLKDDAAFFLGSDAFMTLPVSRRERNLLARTEQLSRGMAFPYVCTLPSDEEEDVFTHSELSEENVFMPCQMPAALLDFPCCLRHKACTKATDKGSLTTASIPHDSSINTTVTDKSELFEILKNYLFVSTPLKPRLFFAGLHRILDPLIPRPVDRRLWLDYLPMIRIMAVLDRAAGCAFDSVEDPDLADALSNRKHRTRRSRKQGFLYYLASVAPESLWRDDDGGMTPKVMVNELAKDHLKYYK